MKYCITIFGCKKYQDVAQVFVREFDFWNKNLLPNSVFFTDDFIEDLNIKQIVINEDISWSLRVAKSLENIDEDYILFLLDDYIIQEKVEIHHLEMIVDNAKKIGTKYCRLIDTPSEKSFGDMRPIKVNNYGVNLQPAIWDRKFLISILIKIDANPWITETSLHNFFSINENVYEGAIGYNLIDYYLNAVIKGKWSREVPSNFIGYSKRPKMSRSEWLYYRTKVLISNSLDVDSKLVVKNILKKVGFNFYS
jgi:hypothetical protein